MPELSSTSRHPAWAVSDIPSVVGRLPTITHPDLSTARAVVRPIPPGQGPGKLLGSICANTLNPPLGEICTIVVPVPCRLELLLKLLIRKLPCTNDPVVAGTTAMP